MKENNDGGPGFERDRNNVSQPINGMSLRDYFAGEALHGFLAGRRDDVYCSLAPQLAKISYFISDAMLKERDK